MQPVLFCNLDTDKSFSQNCHGKYSCKEMEPSVEHTLSLHRHKLALQVTLVFLLSRRRDKA